MNASLTSAFHKTRHAKSVEHFPQFLHCHKPADNITMLMMAPLIGIGAGILDVIFIWILTNVQFLTRFVQDLLSYE